MLKKSRLLLIVLFVFSYHNSHSQDNQNLDVYNWFDALIGKENLAINNGSIHKNYDTPLEGKHRYFDSGNFIEGVLNYEGQTYFNTLLKYDIFEDKLIFNPDKESNYIDINLIYEKVDSFFIYNKKFVKIDSKAIENSKSGYYEEITIGKKLLLYIKHYKESRKIISGDYSVTDFTLYHDFLIKKDKTLHSINSKNEILKLFPSLKKKINSFYESYKPLENKETKDIFIKKLMFYIANLY